MADVPATGDDRPGPLLERTLALALREATTNVVRHAQATTCRVTVARTPQAGALEVNDDGVGGAEDGLPNRDIADRLHLAEGTVRNYLSAAITKLHARNRTEAAATARERGLL